MGLNADVHVCALAPNLRWDEENDAHLQIKNKSVTNIPLFDTFLLQHLV